MGRVPAEAERRDAVQGRVWGVGAGEQAEDGQAWWLRECGGSECGRAGVLQAAFKRWIGIYALWAFSKDYSRIFVFGMKRTGGQE